MGLRSVVGALLLAMLCVVIGCADTEPKRFRVSGTIKFDGKPIPFGTIVFTPDGAKQNSGPQGIAEIRDGQFDTSASGGKGLAGGPTVVQVTGFTAPGGKLLCEHELRMDLPREDSTQTVEVPAKAGVKSRPLPEI